jgi:predicted dienelactone hydrolase
VLRLSGTVHHRTFVAVACVIAVVATGCSKDANNSSRSDSAATSSTTTTQLAWTRNLATVVEQPADLPGYHVYRPKDLSSVDGRLPVIVWANGGCVRYDQVWAPLLERWAKSGFVVVAITTPPGTDPRTATGSTADDQAKAIDWAAGADQQKGGLYAGHLDLHKVVAAGNSCGGITTLTLASRDPRVRAAFVLSGSSVPPGGTRDAAAAIMGKVHVPVGYVNGGPDDISTNYIAQDLNVMAPGVPRYWAHRATGAHQDVSTDPAILKDVAEISTNWIDYSLSGNPHLRATLLHDPCAACPPGTWTPTSSNLNDVKAS